MPWSGSYREEMLLRAKQMQAELEQFEKHLKDVYKGYFQAFPTRMHVAFYNDLLSEIAALERVINSHDPLSSHRISSSNLPFLQAVWDTAKTCKNIVKLRHPVFSGPFTHRLMAFGIRVNSIITHATPEPKRGSVRPLDRVDVIADGGLSWFKVSATTNRSLLFDIAKEAVYCSDSDNDESMDGSTEDLSDVPIVRMARNLKTTAEGHQIRNSNPVPFLVLPRIFEGEDDEVDKAVKLCRRMGISVLCGNTTPPSSPLTKDLLHEMVPNPRESITSTLNIDASVLVALVSDISHFKVAKLSRFGQSQKNHIDLETRSPIIPEFCAVLQHRELVCTREAARTLAGIMHTMGSTEEITRACLLLTPDDSMTREQRVSKYKDLSIHSHSIPSGLQLPIRIVDSDAVHHDRGPKDSMYASARDVLKNITQPAKSVFAYGWVEGITTVTSNAAVIKQLERGLEEHPKCDELAWPSIWVFSSCRPLVGVVKGTDMTRRRRHVGDCNITCRCGLNEFNTR
ncbi:hypothetical protein GGR50DRAFT_688077 [Xylaria sp. CBS 124048]|nr:hypothetical protein GGR50DRAFT_688077 [Xylaria sp. CBS 124048]